MRIHVMSDIHFEHMTRTEGEQFFQNVESLKLRDSADLLVLAGDICQIGRHQRFWQAQVARLCGYYRKALYVPGNHEYYGTSFTDADAWFADEVDGNPNLSNLDLLEYGPVTFNGRRFVGGTMWFPKKEEAMDARQYMSDFDLIGAPYSPFEPDVYLRHQEFVERTLKQTRKGDVVVTHHTPLPGSISPRFFNSPLNPFFMADIGQHLTAATLPYLWIHGHTHDPVDYEHEVDGVKMRVYANPNGYPHEGANAQFWARCAVDIPDEPE